MAIKANANLQSQKIIFHLDMNAFFASVEQACNPSLVGKPVAVVPNADYSRAAILARSYEAKDRGVKTFMRLDEARIACPELVVLPVDHLKYYDVNNKLAEIVGSYTPIMEIYSVDEFFLDMTSYLKLHQKSAEQLGLELKRRIAKEIHPALKCSIGVGSNKLLAKIGSNYKKPDGYTEISWDERHKYLDSLSLDDIWGIGRNSIPKLYNLGVFSTKELREVDPSVLEQIVGSYWIRLKRIANGEYYDPVDPRRNSKPAKSMQHAHTMSTATADMVEIKSLIRKLSEKLASRLRKHEQVAKTISLGLRPNNQQEYGWGYSPKLKGSITLPNATSSGYEVYRAALQVLQSLQIAGVKIRLAVVGVADLIPSQQLGFFRDKNAPVRKLDEAIDCINDKYGAFTVRSADILHQRAKESKISVPRKPMTFHPDY
jgi:DNA polymerase-4